MSCLPRRTRVGDLLASPRRFAPRPSRGEIRRGCEPRSLSSLGRLGGLVQSENGQQSGVDTPLFFGSEVTGQVSEPGDVHRTDLFNEDPSR